jgi:hypothetical protein
MTCDHVGGVREARVVLLGDDEFDGVDPPALLNQCKWGNTTCASARPPNCIEGGEFHFDDVVDHVSPGDLFNIPNASLTQRNYGHVLDSSWCSNDCREPIHLVTNILSAEEASWYYRKRLKKLAHYGIRVAM